MSDIFISYSRKDIAYARLLHKTLKEHDLETWIDWQDIPPSIEWMKEIFTAIEEANTIIFILSESSVLSEVCIHEIDHAKANNKRIIPIVIDDVEPDKVHPALAVINWIFSRTKDELQPATESLIEAINTDYDWVKAHTRLQLRALEWERADQDRSFLLQGTDLNQAENWLAGSVDKQPEPTLKQTRYIQLSRQEAVKRQRRSMISIGAALVVTIVLGIIAVINGQQAKQNAFSLATQVVIAEENAHLARIRELTAISQQSGVRFDVAMLLGAESFNAIENYQTTDNLLKMTLRNPEVLRTISHDGLQSVAISPDGKILASGALDGSIILWDIASNQPHGDPLRENIALVWTLDFSPDGKTLVSGSDAGEIILWDVDSRQIIKENTSNMMIRSVVFSPDGKTLASVGENFFGHGESVILWDVDSMQPIGEPLQGLTGWTGEIAFSPDGEKLACGFGNVIIWDLSGEQPIVEPLKGNTDNVMTIAFSPDGKTLATAGEGLDQDIILWDVESKQPIGEPLEGHTSGISTIAFSPDGKTLASGSWDRTIRLWDVVSGQTLGQPLSAHIARITGIAYSPDGKILVSVSEDGAIVLWNLEGKGYSGEMLPLQNRRLVSGGLSADGKTLATIDDKGTITLIDVASGQPVGDPLEGQGDQVFRLAISPDGKTLASVGGDDSINLWNSSSGMQIAGPLQGHSCREDSCGEIALVFSPDGKILASGGLGEDSDVILWDVASGQPIGGPLQTNIRYVTSVAFSPDGKTLAAGFEGGVLLWDVDSRQRLYELLRGHTDWVMSVAISPDGTTLASGGNDGNIILWDIASGQIIGDPLRGYAADGITSVAFSPNGKVLASGFTDGTISLWEVANGKPLGPALQGHTHMVWRVVFSPDGKYLVSGAEDGSGFIWDTDPVSWLERVCERAGRNFTQEEWEFYFPDEPYRKTCELWPEGK